MRKTLAAALCFVVASAPATARLDVTPDLSGYATNQALLSVSTDYMGSYTLAAGLPDPTASPGKRILVNDLGGGPGYLRSSNGCWVRVSTATAHLQAVAVATSVYVDGLTSSPLVYLTGSAFAGKAVVTLSNACSMPQVTVVAPNGVFGAAGSLGVTAGNGAALSVLGVGASGVWSDFAVNLDGSVTKVRGGSL